MLHVRIITQLVHVNYWPLPPRGHAERQGGTDAWLRVCAFAAQPRLFSWPNYTARIINLFSARITMDQVCVWHFKINPYQCYYIWKSIRGFKSKQISPFVFSGSKSHKVQTKSWVEAANVFSRLCLLNRPGDLQTTHLVGPPPLTIYWRVWLLNRFHLLSCGYARPF